MNLKINKTQLPAKYALGVYKMVDGYPSTIDILYEVVTILEDRNLLENSFTSMSLMKEVSARIDGNDLEHSFDILVTDGWLSKKENAYTLIKHPWIETITTL